MDEYRLGDVDITLDREGVRQHSKLSYPVRYGRFSEVRSPDYVFQFNLRGEPTFLHGKNGNWPHPSEWLKRTLGNDWVYYFSGGYTDVYDCLGEYYIPCFSYPSNSLWTRDPFQDPEVRDGLQAWSWLRRKAAYWLDSKALTANLFSFLEQVAANDPAHLWNKALRLFALLKGRVSVLPPDTRHVDYDVLPLNISDGCLYNCGFCSVKSGQGFEERSREDIRDQIVGLKALIGPDIVNYNALFLGQHDALNCRPELIEYAALTAYEGLGLGASILQDRYLFLFASVDSLLQARSDLWTRLQGLPYYVSINVGLESAHLPTLQSLGKPLDPSRVLETYDRIWEINRKMSNVEISANMLVDWEMHPGHWQSLRKMIHERPGRIQTKGAVYLSPLSRERPKEQIRMFRNLKRRSKVPLFLYLIQRL
ncbi:MAG: hypothetical protein U5L00_16755 [Desulfovermiculus sp.]|nr:hypothetical protein [Desulfovermiculus sp.]